ncbi:MAG TPA: DUF2799 domain-containing protein [Burkholderiaceae bacterium]|nr:DUF2799 domain-containing protein [Burkholderiaceae bacterium]
MSLHRATFVLFAALSLLAGCDTTPKKPEDCAGINWRSEGRSTALDGRPMDQGWRRGAACQQLGTNPDRRAFENGWAEGQATYCTPRFMLREGRRNDRFGPICQGMDEATLSRAWNHGRLMYEADQRIQRLDNDLVNLRARADDAKLPVGDRDTARAQLSGVIAARAQAIATRDRLEAEANANGWGLGR